ncbi:MFS transporter [Kitasatospora sp. NPDC006697]|uniref:MFS transporter n=1 Tax=Kitasatospora sp. NPDC006697 TaxID=3364020 RepID=UPI003677F6E2
MNDKRALIPPLPLLAFGAFAIGTDTFVVVGVLPRVAHDLHVSVADVGWVSTVFALSYGVLAPVLGALTGKVDRRTLMVLSLLGFAAGNVLSALAPSLTTLLLARVATAAAASLYIPSASATAGATAAPERRGRALAVVLGGLSAATVLGVPFGTWLASDIAWRATFWLLAGLGVLCAAAVALMLPSLKLPTAPSLAVRLAPVRDLGALLTVLTTLLFMTGGYTVLTYIGAVLAPATKGSGNVLALLLLAFGVAGFLGTNLGGRAVDRFKPVPVLLVSLVLLGAVLAVVPLARDRVWTAAVLMALWGLAAMATQPAQQHRMFAIAPASGPLLMSLNSSATFLGIALGGYLGGQVVHQADDASLRLLGPIGAGLVLLSLVAGYLGTRAGAAAAPAPAAVPARTEAAPARN